MQLKIGTYNICHCRDFSDFDPNGPEKEAVCYLDKTAKVIEKLNCDIISLNEVFDDGIWKEFLDQTNNLADLSEYEYRNFALGADLEWCKIGNSILSRYPIVNFESVHIASIPENERTTQGYYEDRVLAVADINVHGKIIKVISAHFGLMSDELKKCVEKVCQIIDRSPCPCILMGDFNAEPDNQSLLPIFERLKSASATCNDLEKTFSSYAPKILIDYICVPKSAKITKYTVEKDYKVSDHFPITAEIDI